MPHHPTVARTLQQRYRLRWHGLLIMGCSAHVQSLPAAVRALRGQ